MFTGLPQRKDVRSKEDSLKTGDKDVLRTLECGPKLSIGFVALLPSGT